MIRAYGSRLSIVVLQPCNQDKGSLHPNEWDPEGKRGENARKALKAAAKSMTGQEVALLTGHTGDVTSVAFSPDGSTIASGSSDGTVLLWE